MPDVAKISCLEEAWGFEKVGVCASFAIVACKQVPLPKGVSF
jgi:hypothetical protein